MIARAWGRLLLWPGLLLVGQHSAISEPAAVAPVAAARALLDVLPAGQRAEAHLVFANPARFAWNYVPMRRAGLPIGRLDAHGHAAYRTLIASVLSAEGLRLVDDILRMEEVLHDALPRSARTTRPDWRSPGLYYLAVFGHPAPASPWAMRLEGHHLSLNVSLRGDEILSTEPTFFGSDPARAPAGSKHAGLRPLAGLHDPALRLLAALGSGQRNQAIVSRHAPGNILWDQDADIRSVRPEGVAWSDMPPEAQAHFTALWTAWHAPFRGPAAQRVLPVDALFSWRGAADPARHHYYRIHTADVSIEFSWHGDHIHSAIRHRQKEWGR